MPARETLLLRLSAAVREYKDRGASSAQPLYRAVAAAAKGEATWEEIQDVWVREGENFPSVAQVMDYATLGGFVTRCDERDFRRAAQFLILHGKVNENASLIRVGYTINKMADSYAATIKANRERIQHGRRD